MTMSVRYCSSYDHFILNFITFKVDSCSTENAWLTWTSSWRYLFSPKFYVLVMCDMMLCHWITAWSLKGPYNVVGFCWLIWIFTVPICPKDTFFLATAHLMLQISNMLEDSILPWCSPIKFFFFFFSVNIGTIQLLTIVYSATCQWI